MTITFPSIRKIGSEARILVYVGAITNFGYSFYFVALAVYLSVAGFSPTIIGLLLALEAVVGASLTIPMAMLSDLHGRKVFFILGITMAALASAIFALTLNLALIFIAGTLSGLANALIGAPSSALLAEKATDDRSRNNIFTLAGFAGGVATASGALFSGVLPPLLVTDFSYSSVESFRPLFALGAFLSVVSIIAIQLKIHEAKHADNAKRSRVGAFIKIPRKSMPIVLKFSVLGFIGLGAGLIIPLLPLWFHLRFGLDISLIGPLFSAIMFITAIASLFTPELAKRRGSVSTIALTQISSVPLLISIPFAPTYSLAGVAMVSRSTLMNVAGPIEHSYQMGLIHPDERATALSIIQTFDAIPRSFTPAIGGYLFSLGLLSLPFFITAALYTTSIVLFYLIFRNLRPPDSFEAEQNQKSGS